jgi:ArsR family metal-binding transcriptional regulator
MDAIANISITLYGNGEMAISGNIGDVKLALVMLDHARDAVNNQWKRRDREGLILPPSDVQVPVHPGFPLTQNADVAPDLRMQDTVRPIR